MAFGDHVNVLTFWMVLDGKADNGAGCDFVVDFVCVEVLWESHVIDSILVTDYPSQAWDFGDFLWVDDSIFILKLRRHSIRRSSNRTDQIKARRCYTNQQLFSREIAQVIRLKIGLDLLPRINRYMSQPLWRTQLKNKEPTLPQTVKHVKIIGKSEEFHLIENDDFCLAYDVHGGLVVKVK